MKDEPRSLDATVHWLRGHRAMFDRDEHKRYAIFDRDETTLLGETMLLDRAGSGALEIGYWIDIRHAGQGYATESTAAMVRLGFEHDRIDRLEIHCSPNNHASFAVAEKLGFHHEATLAARFHDCDNNPQDSMVWTLFAKDYPNSPAAKLAIECLDAAGRPLDLG